MKKEFSLKLKINIEVVKERIPIKYGYQNKFKYFWVGIKDKTFETHFSSKSIKEICDTIKLKLRELR